MIDNARHRAETARERRSARSIVPVLVAGAVCAAGLLGCETERQTAAPPPTPLPTYQGPEFLNGTIASLATLDRFEAVLVSGYGLVVGLDGTGSGDSPPALRQWMLDEIAKRGFGQYQTGFQSMSPTEVFSSQGTALVLVEGIVPAGATKGTRFDLLVAALSQTSTTSLAGGRLYSVDLHPGPRDLRPPRTLAVASGGPGEIFMSPHIDQDNPDIFAPQPELLRGRVLNGGVMNQDIPIRMIVNQPSYRLTTAIATRVNARYQRRGEPPIAVAKSDALVEVTVIPRYQGRTAHLLNQISHLFLNPTPEFAAEQTRMMIALLDDPANDYAAESISYALEGFGNRIVPLLREVYAHPRQTARLAALRAGARLGDALTAQPLFEIASAGGADAVEATRVMADLLSERPQYLRLVAMFRQLLDADSVDVRIAAYETLAKIDDTSIQRFAFNDIELAQVRCTKPLIHVTQEGKPRIVVFDDRLGFNHPLMFSAWNNRFMIRGEAGEDEVAVFYQRPDVRRPLQAPAPDNVGYVLGMMAFDPSKNPQSTSPGLAMSYNQIVRVVAEMAGENAVPAPIVIAESPLENLIEQRRQEDRQRETERPETGGVDPQVSAEESAAGLTP